MTEITLAATQVARPHADAPFEQVAEARPTSQGDPPVRFVTKKRVAAAVAVLTLGGGAMAAYAYWTGGGTGSGSAQATTPSAVTVNQTNAAITNLYPGGPAQALSGNFDNPNSGTVYVHNVTAAVRAFSS